MRVGAQRDLFDAAQQIPQRKLARDLGAHGERVDKEAYQIFGLRHLAARDGRAHDDVFLARVAMQQNLERRHQRHEERHVFFPAKLFQIVGKLR